MTPESAKPTCPKGHPLRTRYGRHQCAKAKCGEDKQAEAGGHKIDLDAIEADPQAAQAEQRMTLAQVPKGLKGDEAVKWSQEKMMDLLPRAVANIAWDLQYGTDKQKAEATDRVLRANGMDRRDAGQASDRGLIVLNIGTDPTVQNIPWLQRVKPGGPKTEGE